MRSRPAYLGIALASAATLMLEVLLTRLSSVVVWYHMAFFVIALGMLGMTAGAVWVFLYGRALAGARALGAMVEASMAFAVATPIAVGLALSLPVRPITDVASFGWTLLYGGLLAVPFAIVGVVVTLGLTRIGLPPSRAYAADLLGAAVGAAGIVPVLDVVDAPSAVFVVGAVAAAGAVALRTAAVPVAGRGRRLGGPFAFAVPAVLLVLAWANGAVHRPLLRPMWVKGEPEDPDTLAYDGWNTYSRVTVSTLRRAPPALWGPSYKTPKDLLAPIPQRSVQIDGAAGTAMARLDLAGGTPDPSDLADHRYLEWDVTTFVHRLRPTGPMAVVGIGGGRDVLEAARVGHAPVVGIELNDLIVGLHEGPFRDFSGLAYLPGVELVAAEARAFLARDGRRYDAIVMSLIDTWAATGAGAFSLTENGLYTMEGFRIFLERLSPHGIFTVSRWYKPDTPGETGRMLSLAMETLWRMGADDPRRHIALLQSMSVATLLVAREPFTDADLDLLQREAVRLGFSMVLTPRKLPVHPTLRAIVTQPSSEALAAWAASQPLDFSPPTDDRPFFFNMLRPSDWLADPRRAEALDHTFLGNLRATQTLVGSTAIALLLTGLFVFVPLVGRRSTLRSVGGGVVAGAGLYFSAIGLGFMLVEMALLSRLSVLVGHPTLALAVLLGGMILAAGLGSLASGRLDASRQLVVWLPAAAVVACLAVVAAAMPRAATHLEGAALGTRIAAAAGIVALAALPMGTCFPVGLRLLDRVPGGAELGPWMWGLNGAFGVVASGVGLGLAMAVGTRAALLCGAACYLVLPLAAAMLWRRGAGRSADAAGTSASATDAGA
ncbi:MAG: hypothetical protein D6705_12805 [Deltaproteobacteria bacterium]|nr:MAG: hypothetical protein D6705_12805 [Deltaproteobacteria bacterium]